jgi:hypothetical protein
LRIALTAANRLQSVIFKSCDAIGLVGGGKIEFTFASPCGLLENLVRKILLNLGLCFGLIALAASADTLKLSDGSSLTGDIVKYDDSGVMLHLSGDTYTNILWAQFSQDALQQLSANPKIQPLVEPFIEPTEAQRPPSPEIQVNPVSRLELPADPSVLGGWMKSSVGIFILFVLYAANLFAAFEISVVKARAAAQVMGVAAVLPVIGPIIFLILPMQEQKPVEETVASEPFPEGEKTPEEIQIVEASWKTTPEEKKPEPQVYARGKFTFNKRFVETKFASFMGEGKGDAAKFTMEVKTFKEQFTVERIMQVAVSEVILETLQRGQVTVPLADIQEIKLNPKTA